MLTVKLSKKLRKTQLFEKIGAFRQVGIKQFEFSVRRFGHQKLVVSTGIERFDYLENIKDLIFLEDLFNSLKSEKKDIEVVLNLQEPNLEYSIKTCVEEWGLVEQVRYTGQIEAMNFTPWDSPNIYYNVENCLPNFYQLGEIKKTHVDVIHYFCRKYKMKTIRIHAKAFSSDILGWIEDSDLNLSIYGVKTIESANDLFEKGVIQATISEDTSLQLNQIFK